MNHPQSRQEPSAAEDSDPDLDVIPCAALATLLEVELPRLRPAFGLLPDPLGHPRIDGADVAHRLAKVMADPLEVYAWRGDKRVIHILRHWVIVVWASGRITVLAWRAVSCGQIRLCSVSAAKVDLFRLASDSEWLTQHRDAVKWERVQAYVAQGGKFTARQPRLRNAKIFQELWAGVVRQVRSCRLDAFLRDQLGLNAWVMQQALSLDGLKRRGGTGSVTASAYNWVIDHAHEIALLQQEAPEVISLYARCADDPCFPESGEATQRLRRFLQFHGIGRSGWRLALKHGRRLFADVRHFCESNDIDAWLGLLKLHHALGSGSLVAPRLLRQLVPWRAREGGELHFKPSRALAHLVDLHRENPSIESRDPAEWHAVLNWVIGLHGPRNFNRIQRTHGWSYLVQRAKAQLTEELAKNLLHNHPLPGWHPAVTLGSCRLQFLSDHMALWEEGRSMGHCIGSTSQPLMDADVLVCSVLWEEKHVGTARLTHEAGHWLLQELRGRFNQPLPPQIERAVIATVSTMVPWQGNDRPPA